MGKVAVVTGASSGIGRSVAEALLTAGYNVVLAGRRKDQLEEVAAGKPSALVAPTDVANPDSVRALFKAAVEKFGRVDLLFNNAGVNTAAVPFEDLTDDAWTGVVNVNLNGMFFCAREAVKVMKDQSPKGGRIINNGSISATAPRPRSAPYTATKHAVTGLTKSIALDCRAHDVACGQIDIGNAMTEMAKKMKDGVLQANGTIAPEPLMDVADVASTILYMDSLPLSSNALFLTVMATKMPLVGRG